MVQNVKRDAPIVSQFLQPNGLQSEFLSKAQQDQQRQADNRQVDEDVQSEAEQSSSNTSIVTDEDEVEGDGYNDTDREPQQVTDATRVRDMSLQIQKLHQNEHDYDDEPLSPDGNDVDVIDLAGDEEILNDPSMRSLVQNSDIEEGNHVKFR